MLPAVEQGQRVARGVEPETAEPEPEIIDDGLVCWVCQFADCDERPEEPLLSTGCACCRAGVVEKIVVLAQPDTTLFFTSPATPEG